MGLMELQVPISAILGFLLLVVVLRTLVNTVWKSETKSHHHNGNSKLLPLPPGPRKLPLIGNVHNLAGSNLPHHSLEKLSQQYGPLMHLKLGEFSCIVVSSPEIAKEVMKTHDINFSNRPPLLAAQIITYGSKGITFSPHGTYWRQMRKICTMELLSAKRVESFRSVREAELSKFVKDLILSEGSLINLSEKLDSLAYDLTSGVVFGGAIQAKGKEQYRKLTKDVSKVAGGFSVTDLFPSIGVLQVLTGFRTKLEKLHREMDKIIEDIVTSHRDKNLKTEETGEVEETGEDFVDVLLMLQKRSDLEHPMSNNIIKAIILDIFSAGSETTFTALEWAMSELIKNPDAMERAQAEIRGVYNEKGYVDEQSLHELKYLKSVIKETLRLHVPSPLLLPRECSERCEINGYEIPAKSKVIVNAWSIGRDPKYWIEAERFYPERFLDDRSVDFKGVDFQFIPFGAGRRMCPGIALGIADIEISLANLLFHFDWKMPGGRNNHEELDMSESFGVAARRKHDLWCVPITYHSATS